MEGQRNYLSVHVKSQDIDLWLQERKDGHLVGKWDIAEIQ